MVKVTKLISRSNLWFFRIRNSWGHLMTSRRHFQTIKEIGTNLSPNDWKYQRRFLNYNYFCLAVRLWSEKITGEIGQRSLFARRLESNEWMPLWLRMQKYELRMQLSNFNFSLPQVLHLMEFHYFRYLSWEWSVSKRLLILHMTGPISGLYLVSLKPRHVNLSMRQTRILTYA